MKNLDCNQIKILTNLEIIGEEDKNKKKKKLCNFMKPLGRTMTFNYFFLQFSESTWCDHVF